MDNLTQAERSELMGKIRGKDTRPEMLVRRLVYSMGYRYRLHRTNLPGKPDLVFSKRRKIIFIHGCFWHRHICASGQRIPKSNVEFWTVKLEGNRERDKRAIESLQSAGWGVLIVWECELRNIDELTRQIRKFLDGHDSDHIDAASLLSTNIATALSADRSLRD